MLFNYYEVEQIAKERVKDALREQERARLIGEIEGPGELQGWRLVKSSLASLWSILIFKSRRVGKSRKDMFDKLTYGKADCQLVDCH